MAHINVESNNSIWFFSLCVARHKYNYIFFLLPCYACRNIIIREMDFYMKFADQETSSTTASIPIPISTTSTTSNTSNTSTFTTTKYTSQETFVTIVRTTRTTTTTITTKTSIGRSTSSSAKDQPRTNEQDNDSDEEKGDNGDDDEGGEDQEHPSPNRGGNEREEEDYREKPTSITVIILRIIFGVLGMTMLGMLGVFIMHTEKRQSRVVAAAAEGGGRRGRRRRGLDATTAL